MRTITEILKEVDANPTPEKTYKALHEIKSNIASYPNHKVNFAIEHLEAIANKIEANEKHDIPNGVKVVIGGFQDALKDAYESGYDDGKSQTTKDHLLIFSVTALIIITILIINN